MTVAVLPYLTSEGPAHAEDDVFRNYVDSEYQSRVETTYRLNHTFQTYEFAKEQKERFSKLEICTMSIWEAFQLLDDIIDPSDPDTNSPQLVHALQTAEGIRAVHPDLDWFHLVGFIHDLGKVLCHPRFGANPAYAVVGDTFPLGCAFSKTIEFFHFFDEHNKDAQNPLYSTPNGIYTEGCGFENVLMSWGHDEYLYQVLLQNETTLPPEALYIVRFHSFYPWHRDHAYQNLANDYDRYMLPLLQEFNKFDLYTKHSIPLDLHGLKVYYKGLLDKYFPKGDQFRW